MDFSEELKDMRIRRSFTQKKVSELLGIPRRTYESYECGHRVPTNFVQNSIRRALMEYPADGDITTPL